MHCFAKLPKVVTLSANTCIIDGRPQQANGEAHYPQLTFRLTPVSHEGKTALGYVSHNPPAEAVPTLEANNIFFRVESGTIRITHEDSRGTENLINLVTVATKSR